MSQDLYALRSARYFHEPMVCDIAWPIAGTNCYVVNVHAGCQHAYAHVNELSGYPENEPDGEPSYTEDGHPN